MAEATLWKRIKARLSGSIRPEGTLAAPTGQHQQLTDAEKFKRDHGYSAATDPLPWGEDIGKHNHEVDVEYLAEIDRRRRLYEAGEYSPRFFIERYDATSDCAVYDEVNWDLEMTLRPGARLDLTKATPPPLPTEVEIDQAREAGRVSRAIVAEEHRQGQRPEGHGELLPTRAEILAQCNGDERAADHIEAAIKEMLVNAAQAGG